MSEVISPEHPESTLRNRTIAVAVAAAVAIGSVAGLIDRASQKPLLQIQESGVDLSNVYK